MAATATLKRKISEAEYLRIDREENREKNGKYEYFNQTLIYNSGGTLQHSSICSNTNANLVLGIMQTKGTNSVLIDIKVKSYLDYKNYVYPDGVVSDGRPKNEDEKKDILSNPLLIVEVLSDSTEGFDRGDKFKSYRNIPSVKEYLLISQNEKCIEQFYKDENGRWQFGEIVTEGSLKLKSLNFELTVEDLYFNVDLTPKIIE